jgi:hypothetical protein
MGKGMGVTSLQEGSFFLSCFLKGVINEDLSRNISETAIESTSDQYAAIVEANGLTIGL